jgi:hypothetical protein
MHAIYIEISCNFGYKIPIEIKKDPLLDEFNEQVIDTDGNAQFKAGFKIGGGIDQDHTKSPQNYPDNVRPP